MATREQRAAPKLKELMFNDPEQLKVERRRWARTLAEGVIFSLNIKTYDKSLVAWLVGSRGPRMSNNLEAVTAWVSRQLEAADGGEGLDIKTLRNRLKSELDAMCDG